MRENQTVTAFGVAESRNHTDLRAVELQASAYASLAE